MARKTKLDRLSGAFAAAVAAGRHDEAEGWLATAFFVADRAVCPHTLEDGRHACAGCRAPQPAAVR